MNQHEDGRETFYSVMSGNKWISDWFQPKDVNLCIWNKYFQAFQKMCPSRMAHHTLRWHLCQCDNEKTWLHTLAMLPTSHALCPGQGAQAIYRSLSFLNSEMDYNFFFFQTSGNGMHLIYLKALWKPYKYRFVVRLDPLTYKKNYYQTQL